MEARYYAELKISRSRGVPRLCDSSQTSVVDDAGEEEYEVNEICNYRKSEDGGLEFLVKWKCGDETWEPFESIAETEALDSRPSGDCDCGNSTSEALSRGCVFDALASAWLPPECRDDELTAEFNQSGPGVAGAWPYWAHDNGTVPLTTTDLARLGDTNGVWYSTREWHLVHCNFYWRKLLRARQNGRPLVETRYDNMGHIVHCGEIAKQTTPMQKISVLASVVLTSDV
ncbi:hypothetical protein B0T14DRAFT_568502 [Immersiella caudata]|uniref:Chromo domain-containing protein n=1 Tax=Immersiella caudata TaxID=314043 RepID=A0AA39WKA9_9PEZI|nr:hypothetical protein B0T14DRAFT_568502 [Immersiella caudata]